VADTEVVDAYSPEWAEAFKAEINKSPVYKQAAAGWEGTVGLVVLAEPDKNFPEDRGVFLDLWHGEARDVRVGTREDAEGTRRHQGNHARPAEAERRLPDHRSLYQGLAGADQLHDSGAGPVAGRGVSG
jgi:hypothetical protein